MGTRGTRGGTSCAVEDAVLRITRTFGTVEGRTKAQRNRNVRRLTAPLVGCRRRRMALMTGPTDETTQESRDALHPALEPPPVNHDDASPSRLDKPVFWVSAAVAIGFVVWGALGTDSLSTSASNGLDFVVHNTGWLFSLAASEFV